MLTKEERRLIRTYCLLPKLSIAALLTEFLIGGVFILLVMIYDIGFEGKGLYMLGFNVYITLTVVYLVFFCYGMLRTRFGMHGKKWKAILEKMYMVQRENDYSGQIARAAGLMAAGQWMKRSSNEVIKKAGDVVNFAGSVDTVATAADIMIDLDEKAKSVAERAGIQIPKAKKYIIAIAVIPIIIMTVSYLPGYYQANANKNEEVAVATETLNTLKTAFENAGICEYISCDNPKERYQNYGYHMYAYTSFDEEDNYIVIEVDNAGIVKNVSYHGAVDIHKSKEENLEIVENEFQKLHDVFEKVDVKLSLEELKDYYTLPEEFKQQFIENSYYEEMKLRRELGDKGRVYYWYWTEPEEEFDEYSDTYITLDIDE